MALVTDERDTFSVFNYYNVTWVGGTRQGCDSGTGLASQINPDCEPAQVGGRGCGRGWVGVVGMWLSGTR